MRFNRTKHKLLQELSKGLTISKNGIEGIKPLSIEEIDKFLKGKSKLREHIISELFIKKEIIFTELPQIGYFISPENGLDALTTNKYLDRNYELIKTRVKDIVQILIPILSLIIAILALCIKLADE